MIGIKKAVLSNKTMDVLSMVEFETLLANGKEILPDTCVQIGEYVYPVATNPKTTGGVWISGTNAITMWNPPSTEEEKKEYSADKIVDLSSDKVKDLKGNIEAMDKIKSMELNRLSTIKSVLQLQIQEDDTTELAAIKEAINAKQIDADSYKSKFPSDSDFNNDMRALKSPTNYNISFFKAKRIMNAFDADMYLTIKDKPDAVNPIGKEITVKLT